MTKSLNDKWLNGFFAQVRKSSPDLDHDAVLRDARDLVTQHLGMFTKHKQEVYALLSYISLVADEDLLSQISEVSQQPIVEIQKSSELSVTDFDFSGRLESQLESLMFERKESVKSFSIIKLILHLRHQPTLRSNLSPRIAHTIERVVSLIQEWDKMNYLRKLLLQETEKTLGYSLSIKSYGNVRISGVETQAGV